MSEVLEIENLHFGWERGEKPFLQIPEFRVSAGGKVFLKGNSGSGKSTLLNLIAGIFVPSQGSVRVSGQSLSDMSMSRRDRFRAEHIGVIFQQFNLLPYLSVLENVLVMQKFSRKPKSLYTEKKATRLLESLDISRKLLNTSANRLSFGQQQRVAIARALIGKPELILADEPTSALDKQNRDRFLDLLFSEMKNFGSTLILAGHDEALETRFDQTFTLS